MSDINNVTLTGRLAAKPELKFTASGTAVAEMRLAVNRKRKDKEEVSFLSLKAFGKLAETMAEHKNKGDQIAVVGVIQEQRWEAEDGTKRSRVVILVNEVTFLARAKAAADEGVSEDGDEAPAPRKPKPAPAAAPADDDEIPF